MKPLNDKEWKEFQNKIKKADMLQNTVGVNLFIIRMTIFKASDGSIYLTKKEEYQKLKQETKFVGEFPKKQKRNYKVFEAAYYIFIFGLIFVIFILVIIFLS
ncbi:MAG: hypothetical protein ACFFFB_24760 [Candidatus Heimdallarchaeota archaeon]